MPSHSNQAGQPTDNSQFNRDEGSTDHWISGSCHCQAVKFRCRVPQQPELINCNCSMCAPLAYLHWLVPEKDFELICGHYNLSEYRFHTGQARHWFCSTCGIKSFYRPRSHPDHFSINARCLDKPDWQQWPRTCFDGENWEDNIQHLK